MKRRRTELFEQPSLVPMADMVTNTVGIMLFILIFVALSAGGAVVSRHLPRERRTDARVLWMFCSGGKIIQFDPAALGKQIEAPLGTPSFETAGLWARAYSSSRLEANGVIVAGEATVELNHVAGDRGARIKKDLLIRHDPNYGDDQRAIKTAGSAFQKLATGKSKTENFFFFFVGPDSIPLFRAARDQLTEAGFGVGWSPLGPNQPARISMSGSGREATIQ